MKEPFSHRVRVDTGLELQVYEWGKERPELEHTVFLVHGFLDLAWSWIELVQAGLAERFHVVAFDQRGHGDSDRIGAGGYYHFMDYVADLASLVGQLGRRQVSVVGHSMGGTVASYYAGSHPDRVARLALLEGVGPPEDTGTQLPERARNWIRSAAEARTKQPRAYDSVDAAAERLRKNDPRLSQELALTLAQRGTFELAGGKRVFKHDPLHLTRGPYPFRLEFARAFWEQISCPVLLVETTESPFRFIPDLAERNACFKSSRTHVLEDAAHMMQRHQPGRLAQILIDFLA